MPGRRSFYAGEVRRSDRTSLPDQSCVEPLTQRRLEVCFAALALMMNAWMACASFSEITSAKFGMPFADRPPFRTMSLNSA